MALRPTAASPLPREVVVARLRAQVAALENRRAEQVYPVPEMLAPLLPDRGLKPGSAYCLGVPSQAGGTGRAGASPSMAPPGALLASLLAPSSREGLWCGAVGLPDLGMEAAGLAGVALNRLAIIPHPGAKWLMAVSVLSSAVPVVAVQPSGPVSQADASRLASRMRDNGSVLLVVGSWPGSEATISVESATWSGIGQGWGHLTEHEVTISVSSKRHPRARSVHALLPGADGRMAVSPLARSELARSDQTMSDWLAQASPSEFDEMAAPLRMVAR